MSDLIDRQAALDIYDDYNVAVENGELESYRRYRKQMLELPSAQPGEDIKAMCGECDAWNQYKNYPQPGWIPCSRELPKKDGDYLVTTHSGQIARYIFIGGSSEEYWRRCATAWMPLPTPYREGRQDDH